MAQKGDQFSKDNGADIKGRWFRRDSNVAAAEKDIEVRRLVYNCSSCPKAKLCDSNYSIEIGDRYRAFTAFYRYPSTAAIMAPAAVEAPAIIHDLPIKTKAQQPVPLAGTLDQYESFDITPVIGREFPKANLVEWLNAPNSDELIRDLAVTSKSSLKEALNISSNSL